MEEAKAMEAINECFSEIGRSDARAKIDPCSFAIAFIMSFIGDSKTHSLEAIRRSMMAHLGEDIQRHSFWERLSRKRLRNILADLVEQLMAKISQLAHFSKSILSQLGVSEILLIDSTSISLWDGSADDFPGTRTNAGLKWHSCFNLLSGVMTWFKITPTSTSDQKCFPKIKDLVGKLLLFDLGYWSYGLLGTLDTAGAYFLSRVKSKSVILIEAVVDGLSSCYVGHNLSEIDFKRKRGNIIELMGRVPYGETGLALKVIGFWNKDKKCYHWYCTNLDIEAKLIYPLYRLRWQCELIFKGCKNSLNANQITSNNKNIIESLILASLAAHLITASVVEVARHELSEEKMDAISFQRVAKVLVLLASDFVNFLTTSSKRYLTILLDKLKRFAKELYDPNYKRRKTSLGAMKELLEPFG